MKKNARTLLYSALVGCVLLGVVVYVYTESAEFIRGPVLEIFEPEDGATATSSPLHIKGDTKNISFVSINDRPIFVNERGIFDEQLPLEEGYSIIKVQVKDRFGRSKERLIRVVYEKTSARGVSSSTKVALPAQ